MRLVLDRLKGLIMMLTCADVDDAGDACCQKRTFVACQTEVLEDKWHVVDDYRDVSMLNVTLRGINLLASIPDHCWKNMIKDAMATRLKESLVRKT